MFPAFYGSFYGRMTGSTFYKDYRDAGYIIGQALNFCSREVVDMYTGTRYEYWDWVNFDHELVSLFCDTNFSKYDQPIEAPCKMTRRCLYGKDTVEYSLEYILQFFNKYKDEPKIFKFDSIDAHEGSTEVIKYSDDHFVKFFETFEKEGFLNDTLVIIHTDHGVSMPGPYSVLGAEDWNHEVLLPVLFMLVPTNIEKYEELRDTLKHNEQIIVTPFTIYNSMKSLLGREYRKSMIDQTSLFSEKLSKGRDCQVFNDKEYYKEQGPMECRCSNK